VLDANRSTRANVRKDQRGLAAGAQVNRAGLRAKWERQWKERG